MTFRKLSEGLQEMILCSASAYVDGFSEMEETEQNKTLNNMAETLLLVSRDLGYNLDPASCQIEGIEDQDELENALCDIEHEFDNRY